MSSERWLPIESNPEVMNIFLRLKKETLHATDENFICQYTRILLINEQSFPRNISCQKFDNFIQSCPEFLTNSICDAPLEEPIFYQNSFLF